MQAASSGAARITQTVKGLLSYDAPDEKTYVEIPFIEQLKLMGWQDFERDIDVPYLTERESFRDVLLKNRLAQTVKKISLTEQGKPWLDDHRINQTISKLERIASSKFMEANREAFECRWDYTAKGTGYRKQLLEG